MLDRKALDAQAQTIMKDHAFTDGDGNPLTRNADIFHANLQREVSVFREFLDTTNDKDKINAAKRVVTRACTWYNDEMRNQRLEQLKEVGARRAVITFLGTQRIEGLKVEEDKKTDGVKVTRNLHVGLDAVDFYEFFLTSDYDYIRDLCCIFADNVYRKKLIMDAGDDEAKVKKAKAVAVDAYITKASMSETYLALRKKLAEDKNVPGQWDFDDPGKISGRELQRELNYIMGRMCFLPMDDIRNEKWLIKAVNRDWQYVRDTVCVTNGGKKAKDNEEKGGITNTAGKYIIRDESTIIRAIFTAMYTRYHGLVYETDVENNSGKKSRVTEPNYDMAEPPVKPAEVPEAGAVSLGTPEK